MDYEITPKLLRDVAGYPVNQTIVNNLAQFLPKVLDDYGINTKLRISHFLNILPQMYICTNIKSGISIVISINC